ncbi:MAG: hypothetical protein DMD87_12100 [Candidatus Rokuibacteriota bacterium]|nr:MAG: hypothetical protein DMD87_12100 [Candidatus Rokubacteria bacterium]
MSHVQSGICCCSVRLHGWSRPSSPCPPRS